jgi:hypothetical protein
MGVKNRLERIESATGQGAPAQVEIKVTAQGSTWTADGRELSEREKAAVSKSIKSISVGLV